MVQKGDGNAGNASLSSLIVGKGLGEAIYSNRWTIQRGRLVVGHIAPEAQDAGNVALIKTGDIVTIDQDKKELSFNVSDADLEKRRKKLVLPPLHTKGVLGKYAHMVSSSSKGAITDFFNRDDLPNKK